MFENASGLENLLDILCENKNVHISIHDVSGVLNKQSLSLPIKYRIHSKQYCDYAKSTVAGYDLCIRNKTAMNKKACRSKTHFCGYCPFGVYEVVYPVKVLKETVCIIYVGSLFNTQQVKKRAKTAALKSGNDCSKLISEIEKYDCKESKDFYLKIAKAVADYIKVLSSVKDTAVKNNTSLCQKRVAELKNYIDINYDKNFTLKEMADMYYINEKYFGRIFSKTIGRSFNDYLNSVRLDAAAKMLIYTDNTVLTIALECGYRNVTYFNKVFLKYFGVTPIAYRKNR